MDTRIITLSGFLDSGKTTTMLAAATRLGRAGRRVAVVTNDQAGQLVDSLMARSALLDAGEVAGGCFCCRLDQLMDVIARLSVDGADTISALNKIDLYPSQVVDQAWRALGELAPGKHVIKMSAEAGLGVDELIDAWGRPAVAGNSDLDIDYDRYAAAEAGLAWGNSSFTAAYWFTSSTSFANPAITIGRMLSDTFAGIAPSSVPAFIAAQAVGCGLSIPVIRMMFHPSQNTLSESTCPEPAIAH